MGHTKNCVQPPLAAGDSSFKFKFKVRPAGAAVTAGSAAGSESCTSCLAAAGTGADLACTHAGLRLCRGVSPSASASLVPRHPSTSWSWPFASLACGRLTANYESLSTVSGLHASSLTTNKGLTKGLFLLRRSPPSWGRKPRYDPWCSQMHSYSASCQSTSSRRLWPPSATLHPARLCYSALIFIGHFAFGFLHYSFGVISNKVKYSVNQL